MKKALNGQGMPQSMAHHGTTQFRRVRVLLMDKKEMFITVENKSTKVLQIFEETCIHCGLKETELFGLALLRDNEYFFIQTDTKLQKLAPRMWSQREAGDEPSLTFHFRVMYYVDNVRLLKYRTTRHLYYLQLRENLLSYNLHISEEKCFLLSAYALITDHGPYRPEVHDNNYNYFKPDEYLPSWVIMRRGLDYMSSNLPLMHRDMSSETVTRDAKLIFISELSTPPNCHNFHMYKLSKKKYDETDNFTAAIGPRGFDIYEHNSGFLRLTTSFLWSDIARFNCDKKKFELSCGGANETKLACFARSKEWCSHLRSLCKLTQKWQQGVSPRLAELRYQEDRDAGWWPEMYVPSDLHDIDRTSRGGSEGSGGGVRRHLTPRAIENGRAHIACSGGIGKMPGIYVNSIDTSIDPTTVIPGEGEINGEIGGVNGDHSDIEVGEIFQNHVSEKSFERKISTDDEEAIAAAAAPTSAAPVAEVDAVASASSIAQIDDEDSIVPSPVEDQSPLLALFSTPKPLSKGALTSSGRQYAFERTSNDLSFNDLDLNDDEILIDTPPSNDSQNITMVTPLSSNLSPYDQHLVVRSSTPKGTNVYRHTSYLGTPLSPYLYNQQQQQQQLQQKHQHLHHHTSITRHPMGGSGQQNLVWRASCSGRLMKKQLRSFDCSSVHSTEHIPKLLPPQNIPGYFGQCMYKSTPLSVYNIPIYNQNNTSNVHQYSGESPSSSVTLNQKLHRNSIDETAGNDDSGDSVAAASASVERLQRPPPPSYEDAARNSKLVASARLAASRVRGLDFDQDELICDGYRSRQQVSHSGNYSDYKWTGNGGSKIQQSQQPNILDFQVTLLPSNNLDDNYCVPMVSSTAIETQQPQLSQLQQPQQSQMFTNFSTDIRSDPRIHLHRSSLTSYEQWAHQQQQLQLQAYQVQPQKIKAVAPLYAEQVQLLTPISNRKNLQVFDWSQCNTNTSELKVPAKTLRKASSTESEPSHVIQKGMGKGKQVQRHHSNVTQLRDYIGSDDSGKHSYPLVSALLKDRSLQQSVRSFPSNLAGLVCDGEKQS